MKKIMIPLTSFFLFLTFLSLTETISPSAFADEENPFIRNEEVIARLFDRALRENETKAVQDLIDIANNEKVDLKIREQIKDRLAYEITRPTGRADGEKGAFYNDTTRSGAWEIAGKVDSLANDSRFAKEISEAVRSSPDRGIRSAAFGFLKKNNTSATTDALIDLMNETESGQDAIRKDAITALEDQRGRKAISALMLRALNERDPDAIAALKRLKEVDEDLRREFAFCADPHSAYSSSFARHTPDNVNFFAGFLTGGATWVAQPDCPECKREEEGVKEKKTALSEKLSKELQGNH